MPISSLSQKELGVVLTPPKTVDYIISKLGLIKKDHIILDPCVGPGIFIQKLLSKGIEPEQLYAFDINADYKANLANLGINFKIQDTLLNLFPESYNQFDFIIGNPPYLNKASSYIRENRKRLKTLYGKINAHETYAMFIINSIWRLKNGGKLGFITSDSFLTLITHTKLRKFILNNCLINEVLLAPKNLFHNQKVSTNPVIVILTKCTGKENGTLRNNNVMRIIPRIEDEDEYRHPTIIHRFIQQKYHLLPSKLFFIDVEEEIITLFEKAPKLKEFIKGYIGMHTHNNLEYIAAIENTELSRIFTQKNEKIKETEKKYKIISEKELKSGNWKRYLKRGGADQYYRPIMEALDWNEDSIPIYDIPNNVPFESEGIVISGVSSRLAARYMPEGCYWDSNKAIGFVINVDSISIDYTLGVLNSSLYNYLAKGIINNTSSIQISGIHELPFIIPDNDTKKKIELLVKTIIQNKKRDLSYNYINEQEKIDNLVFELYSKEFNFPEKLKQKLDIKSSNY